MNLKQIREKRGLSQKQLSEQSGINIRSLQDYEQGHKNIVSAKAETVYRLSLALGCTMEDILGSIFFEIGQNDRNRVGFANRLQAYNRNIAAFKDRIERQHIYSEKYNTYGRWNVQGDDCILLFLYRGELVKIPFEAYFSEKTFPWLVDAAILKMNSYIQDRLFHEQYEWEEGESWDEF